MLIEKRLDFGVEFLRIGIVEPIRIAPGNGTPQILEPLEVGLVTINDALIGGLREGLGRKRKLQRFRVLPKSIIEILPTARSR